MRTGNEIAASIAESVNGFGGHLRCEVCGTMAPLGRASGKVLNGWPKCCGYTMRWWTQSELDKAAAAVVDTGEAQNGE